MTRIQRHFRPLTVRSRFSLERLLGLSPLTARQIFPTLSYESLEDTITEEPAPPSQINKPLGEAGKNYRLLKESQLDKSTFTTIEKYIQELVDNDLDTTVTISKQERNSLNYVLSKAKETFPCLLRYDNNWLAYDFVKVELRRRIEADKRELRRT